MRKIDYAELIGTKINSLTVCAAFMKQMAKRKRAFFKCVCDCGNKIDAYTNDVMKGKHRSCGCLQIKTVTKHGHARLNAAGKSITYTSWVSMNQRCSNPNTTHFSRYGGRGISVCAAWKTSFAAFLLDMGERPSLAHSLDRIDNDGHYCKANCRWATKKEQAANRHNNPKWQHRIRRENGTFA